VIEFRTGLGWDLHRLGPNRKLVLGGVVIPSDLGFEAHSDGDVLAHAITDALLGAAALGDIGAHFPDSDARWKDADSSQFLEHAASLVREAGYRIVNIDSTVILQTPKLAEHRPAIRESLARTLMLEIELVSIKFKTSEKVGPVGEGLAAEARAIATICREA
jgi:2-C-methyl-D-erythritol 2,4-cyclodiphosphate synthase